MSTSDPGTPSASEDPTNYTKVGLVTSNPLSLSRNLINVDDKDSGDGTNHLYGRLSGTFGIEGHRAKDGNAGMTIVRDAVLNKDELYVLRTTNVAGELGVYGVAKIESYDEGSDDEAAATASATLQWQGVPTFFTVST